MVEQRAVQLDRVFGALSDATRRAMLKRLAGKGHTVGELAEPFAMSLAAASKHIRVLEEAGLIRRTVQGRTHYCRLDARPLAGVQQWVSAYERFWSSRLDALERELLEATEAAAAAERRKP